MQQSCCRKLFRSDSDPPNILKGSLKSNKDCMDNILKQKQLEFKKKYSFDLASMKPIENSEKPPLMPKKGLNSNVSKLSSSSQWKWTLLEASKDNYIPNFYLNSTPNSREFYPKSEDYFESSDSDSNSLFDELFEENDKTLINNTENTPPISFQPPNLLETPKSIADQFEPNLSPVVRSPLLNLGNRQNSESGNSCSSGKSIKGFPIKRHYNTNSASSSPLPNSKMTKTLR